MNREQATAYLRENHRGVLATLKRDGTPQLSNVAYLLDSDGEIKVSLTEDRAKTRNIRRDPRVSLLALGANWYEYLVAEGEGRIIGGAEALPLLRHVYEGVTGGPHPDWAEYDEAMVRDRRVVLSIVIARMYPLDETQT